MSLLNTGVCVLFTSFTSYQCFHHLEPRSKLPLIALLFVVPAILSVPISYHVPWPSAAVLLAFVTYGGAVSSFALIYRLSPFHPLAKYPGPAIAKTSKLWAAYLCAKGDMHRLYKSLHDRYGDVMRVGPNELSIRDSSLIHPILGQGGLPKGPRWEGRDGPQTLIAQRDPILHMHQRKSWNRAFSSAAMKEFFGGGFEMMKAGGDIDGLWTLLESGMCLSAVTSHVPYVIPLLIAIGGQRSSRVRFRTFCKERALERLRMGANRKDLFYYLSGEELPETERLSPSDVAKDGQLAIVAGSDTTSSVLTAALYYLLRNPGAYECLQAEVDRAFPSGEEPLDQLTFAPTNSNETLHLQPASPSGSQRTVGKVESHPSSPFTISRVRRIIPEETQLCLHTYSIHRDPRNFHTPEAFLPERWLSTSAPVGEHNTAAFFPFSYGPTICVGKNLALMEMRMVLCWVLRRFRFSSAPGVSHDEWEGKILDWFIVRQDPLLVNVSLRE
ncbi:high nitrogen upregulated cytochrome P450 monooxygenase 2 [Lactarius hengduanensis]|nr:high nitrogen upregulated cytochrome P450 monooxygenase 2 [Lactarius hengduanensis]